MLPGMARFSNDQLFFIGYAQERDMITYIQASEMRRNLFVIDTTSWAGKIHFIWVGGACLMSCLVQFKTIFL